MNNRTINNGFSVFGIGLPGGWGYYCFGLNLAAFSSSTVSLDVIFQFRHVVYFIFIKK